MIDQLQRVERAFRAAVDWRQSSAGKPATPTILIELCENDEQIRLQVESLLAHLDEADAESGESCGFLNPAELHGPRASSLIGDAALQEWGGAAIGQRIGEFTLIGQLGAGGMGIVYVAEQQHPRRTVALKIIRRTFATIGMIARFKREAELMGRLSHPGIAQIYAAGVADVKTIEGAIVPIPYIAMELIRGLPMLDHVTSLHLKTNDIIHLMIQACDAVQHAHQRGVIHRDLKPANLLVAFGDIEPHIKVLDFGVARAIDSNIVAKSLTHLTDFGHIIGTPAYMSPEQIAGQGAQVDGRCDVYALGAILFQLLTGKHAIDLTSCSLPEAARRIAEQEPLKLSSIHRNFRGDLETIVCKAIEKIPASRYASPADLARDLRHFVDGEPIEARRASVIRHLRSRAAKFRAVLSLIGSMVVVLVFFMLLMLLDHRRSTSTIRAAEDAQRAADERAEALTRELLSSRLAQAQLMMTTDSVAAQDIIWGEYARYPDSPIARDALRRLYVAPASPDARTQDLLRVLKLDPVQLRATATRDGKLLATIESGSLILWSVEPSPATTRTQLATFILPKSAEIAAIGFSPDGSMLAAEGEDRTLHLWSTTRLVEITTIPAP